MDGTTNLKLKGAAIARFGTAGRAARALGISPSRLSLLIHDHVRPTESERHAMAAIWGHKLLKSFDEKKSIDMEEIRELRELAKVFESAGRLPLRERQKVAAEIGISRSILERRAAALRARGIDALYRKQRSDRGSTRFFSPELQTFAIIVFFKRVEASYEDVWRAVKTLALTLSQAAPGYFTVRRWVRDAISRKGLAERKSRKRRRPF